MEYIETLNAKIAYERSGNKKNPGLVLIHGTGADSQSNWGHLIETFSEHWNVVCPNLPGSGQTLDDGAPLSLEILAQQIIATAKDANAIPFDLIGFSLGAALAAYITAEYPEMVRATILLAGFLDSHDCRSSLEFKLWQDLIKTDRKALSKVILLTGFRPSFISQMTSEQLEKNIELMLETNNWEGMQRQIELNLNLDIKNNVKKINKPTLVVGCTYDHMVPKEHAIKITTLIPLSKYIELMTGHLVIHEAPERIVELARDFFLTERR